MPFPDEPDDEFGFVPPLPPDDRLWRHPSERHVTRPTSAPPAHRHRRSRRGVTFGLGVVLVAVAGLAVVASMRHDAGRFASGDEWSSLGDIPPTLVEQVGASIVRVSAQRPDGAIATTGLMVSDDGHLVTAADPIVGATSITVRVADGSVYNATIVGIDRADDIAVLDIARERSAAIHSAAMTTERPTSVDERVFVIGRAGDGARPWIATATIDAVQQRLIASDGSVLLDMLRTTVPDVSDSIDTSSGVVCAGDGTVLGLMSTRHQRPATSSTSTSALLSGRSIAYATPMAWIARVSNEIIASGSFHRAWIGVVAEDAPNGARVHSVSDRGPADRAGIEPGDVITAIGGTSVTSADQLAVLVRSLHPGDRTTMKWIRSDSNGTADVVVSEQI